MKRKHIELIIPDKLSEEVNYLTSIGYSVKKIQNNVVELLKWKWPPITFLFYFPLIIFLPVIIINWIKGYRFHTFVHEHNGEIVVSNNPPKYFNTNDNNAT